jgi:hypothetical protein
MAGAWKSARPASCGRPAKQDDDVPRKLEGDLSDNPVGTWNVFATVDAIGLARRLITNANTTRDFLFTVSDGSRDRAKLRSPFCVKFGSCIKSQKARGSLPKPEAKSLWATKDKLAHHLRRLPPAVPRQGTNTTWFWTLFQTELCIPEKVQSTSG